MSIFAPSNPPANVIFSLLQESGDDVRVVEEDADGADDEEERYDSLKFVESAKLMQFQVPIRLPSHFLIADAVLVVESGVEQ